MARTGRRPGNVDTRTEIVTAARTVFAEVGYDGASVRGIARAAGVDPALVHHYFSGKSALFAEVMQLPLDPRQLVPQLLAGDRAGLGLRIATTFLRLWDSPDVGPRMVAVVRTALASDEGSQRLGQFFAREVLGPVAAQLGADRPELRAALVGSQLMGLAVGRYLVRLPALAAAPPDAVAAAVAPTLQRYLAGSLLPSDEVAP